MNAFDPTATLQVRSQLAYQLAADLFNGDERQLEWYAGQLGHFPRTLICHVHAHFSWVRSTRGFPEAINVLYGLRSQLGKRALLLTMGDDDVRALAKSLAERARALVGGARFRTLILNEIECIAADHGIVLPKFSAELRLESRVARWCDERWWRRIIRKTVCRQTEAAAIRVGAVSAKRSPYVSESSLARRKTQKRQNRAIVEQLVAISDDGACIRLEDAVKASVSTPYIRRSELMARLAGFDRLARTAAHRAVFITVTCPSRMHSRLQASGAPNPKYDGTRPDAANRYLGGVFARIRAKARARAASGLRLSRCGASARWYAALASFGLRKARAR